MGVLLDFKAVRHGKHGFVSKATFFTIKIVTLFRRPVGHLPSPSSKFSSIKFLRSWLEFGVTINQLKFVRTVAYSCQDRIQFSTNLIIQLLRYCCYYSCQDRILNSQLKKKKAIAKETQQK